MLTRLKPMFFDPNVDPIVTTKSPGPGKDILTASANNLYSGVSLADLKGFTEKNGLNSRLVKTERPAGRGGLHASTAATRRRSRRSSGTSRPRFPFATEPMANALQALVQLYRTGDDGDRAKYDIAWVNDKDVGRGHDQRLHRGLPRRRAASRAAGKAWSSTSTGRRPSASSKFADNAQWFEDHMPYDAKFRKPMVKGIVANAIDVVVETGDSGPVTPIGINLPNDQSDPRGVRQQVGVAEQRQRGERQAHAGHDAQRVRVDAGGSRAQRPGTATLAGELLTDMHEVIGHASGRQADGFKGTPQDAIKEYFSALEEGRADLVGLYFIADPEARRARHRAGGRAGRDRAHRVRGLHAQRPRAAAAGSRGHADRGRPHAQPADGGAVADGQHQGDRGAAARRQDLLRDGRSQGVSRRRRPRCSPKCSASSPTATTPPPRRSSTTHGIHFDPKLRDEVVTRVEALKLPSYTGFVMPKLTPVTDAQRQDHRRHGVVPAGPDDADAGILGRQVGAAFRRPVHGRGHRGPATTR